MTIEEFDNTKWGSGMYAQHKDGNIYQISNVDFDEKLVGLLMNIIGGDEGDVSWVRCENVKMYNQ